MTVTNNVRRPEDYTPAIQSNPTQTNAAPPPPTQDPAGVPDARPMQLLVPAWAERDLGVAPISQTGTPGVTADRGQVTNIGAAGVQSRDRRAPDVQGDDFLREAARARATGIRGERILLAQVPPRQNPNIATDAPTGLQIGNAPGAQPNAQVQGNGQVQGGALAAPIDLNRLSQINDQVQHFNVQRSVIPQSDVRAIQQHFQSATDALRRGDYRTAERELNQLGFPLPGPGQGTPSDAAGRTAYVLGASTGRSTPGGGYELGGYRYGARGNQTLNDVNSFAANARMVNQLTAAGISNPSNPPTEAQALQYMQRISQPGQNGQRPDAATVVARAGELVDGSIIHYSSAGAQDPVYNANPNPRYFFRDRQGQVQVFDSQAAARQAAGQLRPPPRITRMDAHSPDEWSDISSKGQRSGRNIGDCESKLYMQQRLLTAAGFTSLGSIDVQHGGGIGHMFGAFRSPDGRVFVTSNESAREVRGSGPNGAVTQADLDNTVRAMTAEVYHVQPNRRGVIDTSGFRFSAARTQSPASANDAVLSIRRASENGMMRRTENLI